MACESLVIPAKTGIQFSFGFSDDRGPLNSGLDSRFRGNDANLAFWLDPYYFTRLCF